jgi:hypothetical protein
MNDAIENMTVVRSSEQEFRSSVKRQISDARKIQLDLNDREEFGQESGLGPSIAKSQSFKAESLCHTFALTIQATTE